MKIGKLLLGSLAALAAALLLAACSGKSSTTSSDGKITLRTMTRNSKGFATSAIYFAALKQFEKDHPNVKIVDSSIADENAYNNLLKTSRASNDLPDIFRVEGVANLSEYIKAGLITNIDPIIKADPKWGDGLSKGALSYLQVPGFKGTWGVPQESGLVGVYYNKEIFKRAGYNEFPQTFSEFEAAIKKIRSLNITPIGLGAKDSYSIGHIHNLIFYHMVGVDAAKELGERKIKWTDPKIVATIEKVKELNDMKAFAPDSAGISRESAFTDFLTGKAAMFITGPWDIPNMQDKSKTKLTADFAFAKFPYFEDEPQFKDNDMQAISAIQIRGDLTGEKKKMAIELAKALSSEAYASKMANETNQIFPRTDYTVAADKSTPLFRENVELAKTSTNVGVDVFGMDPLQSMQDVTRNALVGVLQGDSPKKAAETIQQEIDNSK
ncbi:ABC transporter substrate-binding protein [Lacticaseibacillus yichunensis]|uniref:ABC transporter substrate-binding protein n=1 Tax=Lacticaseibacillus yichunensis TaxID=2486015 RepID=A0ABW4CMF9_9LACO|nr:extracellular solute-binding protein [Lacticaseibacillus yichunensis]